MSAGIVTVAEVTAGLLAAFSPSLAEFYGYPDMGVTINAGLPFARIVAYSAAAVVTGNLLLAAVLAPGDRSGTVSPVGYRGLRAARPAGAVLAMAALAVSVLTLAESVGTSPGDFLTDPARLVNGIGVIEPSTGWAILAIVSAVVAVSAGLVLSWRGAVGLLIVMLAGLAAASMTSVGNSERSHDWAGDSITLHTLGATVWVGSTVVVVVALSRGWATVVLLRRHRIVSVWAFVVIAGSAVAPTLLAARPRDIGTSGYGLLAVLGLVAAVVAVAVHRWGGADRSRRAAVRVAVGELVLLTVAAAAGTAMTRLLPPAMGGDSSRLVFLLGYELPAQMTALDLMLRWRIDLLFAPLAIVAACAYLLGVRRLRRSGAGWPRRRTALWLAGCATVLAATSSGIGTYATAVFSVHMLAHALLGTAAPALLVLGHGLTLLRASSPKMGTRVDALMAGGFARTLRQPAVAWVLVAIALFGLYGTGAFDTMVLEHWSHPVMDAAALGTGLLLFSVLLGRTTPAGGTIPVIGLLAMVFAVMSLHAGFSIWLLSLDAPLAGQFYRALQLPFVPDLLADQRRGALIAWVVGESAMAGTVVVLVHRWIRTGDPTPSDLSEPVGSHRG